MRLDWLHLNILTLCALGLTMQAHGQQSEQPVETEGLTPTKHTVYYPYHFSVGWDPFKLIDNAFWFSFERPIGGADSYHHLRLSPIIYVGHTRLYEDERNYQSLNLSNTDLRFENFNDSDEVSGFGLEAWYAYEFSRNELGKSSLFSWFVVAGVGYHRINLQYEDVQWQTYTLDDGLTAYRLDQGIFQDDIDRLDLSLLLSARVRFSPIDIDLFFGMARRHSQISSGIGPSERHDQINSHGHAGWAPRFNCLVSYRFREGQKRVNAYRKRHLPKPRPKSKPSDYEDGWRELPVPDER